MEARPDDLGHDIAAEERYEHLVANRVSQLGIDAEAHARMAAARAAAQPLPRATPLPDFLAQHDPDPTWRISSALGTGSNAMVVAQYKAGKSTTIANCIRSLADGVPFLGTFDCQQSRITLIDNELDERTLRRWLRDQDIQHPENVRVISLRGRVSSFDILDPNVRAGWADALRGSRVVVFDCLRPALDGLGLSEDKDAGRFLTAFDALKYEAGVQEALVVHHMGHNGERSRGDSRILDWPDVTWKITREDKDNPSSRRYFSAFGRDVDIAEAQLEFDPATRHLSLGVGSRKDAIAGDLIPDIVEYLQRNPGGQATSSVERALLELGHPRSAIRKALELAERQGATRVVKGPRNANVHHLNDQLDHLA